MRKIFEIFSLILLLLSTISFLNITFYYYLKNPGEHLLDYHLKVIILLIFSIFYIGKKILSYFPSMKKIEKEEILYSIDLSEEYNLIKASEGSSGYDIRVKIKEPLTLNPGESFLFHTGLRIHAKNKQIEAHVRMRSGISSKHLIMLLNGIGTIDNDYRGEIRIPIINMGKKPYTFQPNERIGQLVFTMLPEIRLTKVDKISDDTERGPKGFGSSGKK